MLQPWPPTLSVLSQTTMLEQHEKKKSEFGEWSGVVNSAVSQKDSTAKEAVLMFQRMKKKVVRSAARSTKLCFMGWHSPTQSNSRHVSVLSFLGRQPDMQHNLHNGSLTCMAGF